MTRIDDTSRVFDVSRPNKVGPTATSKPVIPGHHPIMSDPMVREDNHYTSHSEKKITPVHVITEDEPHPTMATHETKNPPAFHVPEHTFDPSAGHGLVTPKVETKEINMEPAFEHHYTPVESLLDDESDKAEQHHIGSHHEGGPPVTALPLPHPHGAGPRSPLKKIAAWLATLLVLGFVGGYLAIDAGLVKSSIKLPFEIFKDEPLAQQPTATPPAALAPPPAAAPAVPTGFTAYSLLDTGISFAYPTDWGAPSVTKDPGFSKRGGALKSDGTYAHLINFATNKDIQLAITSNKYLSGKRAALYYDFLQWCLGTNDAKFYKQMLRSTTTNGIDTPTTVTCDQGPLTDATKLDEQTLSQPKTKGPDNKDIGDLYTRNLTDKELVVLRAKDATMKNADNIKKLLGTIQIASTTP